MTRLMHSHHDHVGKTTELLVVRRLLAYFTESQVEKIIEIIDSVCHECWDDNTPCYCTRDD